MTVLLTGERCLIQCICLQRDMARQHREGAELTVRSFSFTPPSEDVKPIQTCAPPSGCCLKQKNCANLMSTYSHVCGIMHGSDLNLAESVYHLCKKVSITVQFILVYSRAVAIAHIRFFIMGGKKIQVRHNY